MTATTWVISQSIINFKVNKINFKLLSKSPDAGEID